MRGKTHRGGQQNGCVSIINNIPLRYPVKILIHNYFVSVIDAAYLIPKNIKTERMGKMYAYKPL